MEIVTCQLPFNFNMRLDSVFADGISVNQMEETVKKSLIGCLQRPILMMQDCTAILRQ